MTDISTICALAGCFFSGLMVGYFLRKLIDSYIDNPKEVK